MRGNQNKEELKDKIVVIDDPVSGMDGSALFIVHVSSGNDRGLP